jgi:HlyD family secretion protein
MLKRLVVLVVLLGGAGYGYWHVYGHVERTSTFLTAAVDKGDILTTINATGTIEPEEVIDIGAQVQGMITEFGRDPNNPSAPIDYGSRVEKGTVLARIDESVYKAAVKQATANLRQLQASVHQAEAYLRSLRSKQKQTRRDWERVQKLEPTKALSSMDVDTAMNAYETADAAVPAGEAALESAKRAVDVSTAALETAQLNLNYCTISSPVRGVIVDRRVNIGQTVVASLSAPSLFLLAKDLSRLQIWVSVNEADIGQIQPGVPVSFRVATYPGERFKGKVQQIRLNATMTQNVVTYTVVVATDNPDGRLLPYMTATVDFQTRERRSVLRVPSLALRWQPTPQQVAPEFRAEYLRSASPQAGFAKTQSADGASRSSRGGERVWVEEGAFLRPVSVDIGLSDGAVTEIVKGELREGMRVVVGETTVEATSELKNPFAPKLPAKK